jgi:hypothetical protein
VTVLEFRWCAGCEADTPFEAPPCDDGHGLDCLDLACVECGLALVAGVLLETTPATRHATRRSA